MTDKALIAGNWKMNGLAAQLAELDAVCAASAELGEACDLLLCPPATLISAAAERAKGRIAIGGQNCHASESGAHTGEISAEMLRDARASHVILGHSERRADNGEDDAVVAAKTKAAWRAGLVAIVCVGETEQERDAGSTLEILGRQLAGSLPEGATRANAVLAYEPVWAIGTGRTPTVEEVREVHGFLRARLAERFGEEGAKLRILYGGSVKPANAAELLSVPDVGGALVGGASLKADDFIAICRASRPA
ncbi:triose-phosphate isomerase [Aureimonas populi]|uniref:Triosephosphate isomerase n=1 Tax=Aureimonas populi TaxID=1701758 RepID=A0ABW5CQ79_9HYPH|nr:triose-phosphate isomerase [Aureimonas populi]